MARNDRATFEKQLRLEPLGPEMLQQLVRDLRLGTFETNELRVCLAHIEADLSRYLEISDSPNERDFLVSRRERLADCLTRLADELRRQQSQLQTTLPNGSLKAIGELIHPTEAESALGSETPPYYRKQDGEAEREALGLQHGGALLLHMIDRVLSPIDAWLEQNAENPGGRPPDRRRRFIVSELAKAAPNIIGAPATATANGKFEKLCVAVFHAYDLSTRGLSDAIEDVLRERP